MTDTYVPIPIDEESVIGIGVNMDFYKSGGDYETIFAKNVYEEDAKFVKENNIHISIEQLSCGDIAMYVRHETEDEDEEIIVIAGNRSCQETLKYALQRYRDTHANKI